MSEQPQPLQPSPPAQEQTTEQQQVSAPQSLQQNKVVEQTPENAQIVTTEKKDISKGDTPQQLPVEVCFPLPPVSDEGLGLQIIVQLYNNKGVICKLPYGQTFNTAMAAGHYTASMRLLHEWIMGTYVKNMYRDLTYKISKNMNPVTHNADNSMRDAQEMISEYDKSSPQFGGFFGIRR